MRRWLGGAVVFVAASALAGSATSWAAPTPSSALPSLAAAPAVTAASTVTAPPIPSVPLSVTDGQDPTTLLDRAISLTSFGLQDSALQAQLSTTQQELVSQSVTAAQASQTATQADAKLTAVTQQAATDAADYAQVTAAVRQTALTDYISGTPQLPGGVSTRSLQEAAWGAVYIDTTLTPNGILNQWRADEARKTASLAALRQLKATADQASATASAASQATQVEVASLQAQLGATSSASASTVLAEQSSVAQQASRELVSGSSLAFTPSSPLPAQVTTTSVALEWAFAELGKEYVWGATGPDTFDCSGLTQYVWAQAGVSIPRVAADQDSWAVPVPLSQLLPGDLVFFGTTDIHHVGIYIGDGLMIDAPETGTVVQVNSIWWSDLAGFGRVHDAGTPVPEHSLPSASEPAQPVVVAAAGSVPSQAAPPAGWVPADSSSAPLPGYYPSGSSSSSTSTSLAPTSTSTSTSTTDPPSPATTDAPTTTQPPTTTTPTTAPPSG